MGILLDPSARGPLMARCGYCRSIAFPYHQAGVTSDLVWCRACGEVAPGLKDSLVDMFMEVSRAEEQNPDGGAERQ